MTPQEKARETRQRNAEVQRERHAEERERRSLIIEAMKRVLSNPDASPTELLDAARLLTEVGK